MTSAVEVFARQLVRAASAGHRHLSGLAPSDRDDVIAGAVLWCWEHRADFDQHKQPLVDWVGEQLQRGRRKLHEVRGSAEALDTLIASEDTEHEAAARIAIERLTTELQAADQEVVKALAEGLSVREVATRLGVERRAVRSVQSKIRKLRDHAPEGRLPMQVNPHEPIDTYEGELPKAPIDHAIEALLRMPEHGRDCPPCWKCMWYYGLMPAPGHFRQSQLVEADVRYAVRVTEARKIQIANGIRAVPVLDFTGLSWKLDAGEPHDLED
jgi:DNA-directed RNA polymerase specialized sigma24 family protein